LYGPGQYRNQNSDDEDTGQPYEHLIQNKADRFAKHIEGVNISKKKQVINQIIIPNDKPLRQPSPGSDGRITE
jgi:hypothetical protein